MKNIENLQQVIVRGRVTYCFALERKIDSFERILANFKEGGEYAERGPCGGDWTDKILSVVNASLTLKRPKNEIIKLLQMLVEIYLGNMSLVRAQRFFKEEPHLIEYQVLGSTYCHSAGPDFSRYMASITHWREPLLAAMLLRRNDLVQEICAIDESLFHEATWPGDALDWALYRLYKGVFTGGKVDTLMSKVSEASASENIEPDRKPFAYQILLSDQVLLGNILSDGSEKMFQEDLGEALQSYQEFWSRSKGHLEESKADKSLALTALCALAYDHRGYHPGDESEFITEWLVRGEFD
ncbi:Imm49 family immunity protein [Spongorhabdus nitratireducens]